MSQRAPVTATHGAYRRRARSREARAGVAAIVRGRAGVAAAAVHRGVAAASAGTCVECS